MNGMMEPMPLPEGIGSRVVPGINGLDIHMLEAGHGNAGRPCVLLLHGFPELAYSWRKVMLPLAEAGYHVIAPDQRGYGRTTGCNADFDGELAPFRMLNLVRDAMGLLAALGYDHVEAVIGHDFGSFVAAHAALIRPDVFRAVVLMSAPFAGPPTLPIHGDAAAQVSDIHADLAALARPRKHYQWYYSTREANADMWRCEQGVHDFLRAYFHHKSADWAANKPFPLTAWTAEELAKMPTYYIMDLAETMAETVAKEMPPAAEVAKCAWLPDDKLAVYAAEYERNGFQGGLQWYRCKTSGLFEAEMQVFSGRTIDVPAAFIAGKNDWGVYQVPGALEKMSNEVCPDWRGCHLIEGAGHWVQQEQSAQVLALLTAFLNEVSAN